MGYFSNVKRHANKLPPIEGQVHHVRSLTPAEVKECDSEAAADRRLFVALFYGLCDEHGAPVLSKEDESTFDVDVPQATQLQLYRAIQDATNPPRADVKKS